MKYAPLFCFLLLVPGRTSAQEVALFGATQFESLLKDDLKKPFEKQENPVGFRYEIQGTPFFVQLNLKQNFLLIRSSLPSVDFTLEKINTFNAAAIYSRAYQEERSVIFETPVILTGAKREHVLAAFQFAEKEWHELRGTKGAKTLAAELDVERGPLLSSDDFEAMVRNDWKKDFVKKQTKFGFSYDVKDTPYYVNFNETGRFVLIYRNVDNHLVSLSRINAFNQKAIYSRAYLDETTLSFELPCSRLALSRGQVTRMLANANQEWADFAKLAQQAVRLAAPAALFSEQEGRRRWNFAVELGRQGRYADAVGVYQQVLPWAAYSYGKASTETARLLNDLSATLCQSGQFALAEPYLERALRIREARLGKEHQDVADTLNTLSNMYQGMGLYSKAEPCVARSLQIWESSVGKEHAEVAHLHNNLGNLYGRTGQYAKAESAYLRCLQIRERLLGANHSDLAQVYYNLSILHSRAGQRTKAESTALRCLRIWETNLGADHPYVGDAVRLLGDHHLAIGQLAKAEEYYQRSLRIAEAKLGKGHYIVGNCLSSLALVHKAKREWTQAENLLERALQIEEASLGKDHPTSTRTLGMLATLHVEMGQHAKALATRERVVQLLEGKLGKDHPDVAGALNNFANSLRQAGQADKAEAIYQRALAIAHSKLGSEHPTATLALDNLAWNFATRQAWPTAVEHAQKSRRAQANYLATVLPTLSEQEQLSYLSFNAEWSLHRALSLGWQAPRQAADASAEWLLNGKALTHQSLAEQHILARDSADPAHRRLFQDLQETRSRLAALVNQSPKTGFELDYQREIQSLKKSENALAQALARAVGRPQRANTWVALDELKAKLGPKAAFVDIARFEAFDFAANKSAGPRFAAWITVAQGPVQFIDLGPADAIDKLVAETRTALIDSAKAISKVGETEALATLQKPLDSLSAKVLHPLLPELQKFEEWIICPDGALWLTPWNALSLPDGKFCVEKHLIRQVVSGRDLILESAKAKAESAYLFADPDYDLSPGKVGGSTSTGSSDDEDTRFVNSSLGQIPKVARLPGTALEAETVRPKIQAWLGTEPKVFLEGQAGEAMVKAVKNPRVLTLATHGYFLPMQKAATNDGSGGVAANDKRPAVLDVEGQPLANPLLRCGLLFAGCNRRNEAKPGDNDGILTGLEVVGMNLNGCELVVLSACETGLGDVRGGEGVAGLRQAFQLAGARGVLASLWQVPDRETALLMNTFYGELTQGKTQAQALREAQRQRIAARRTSFGAAHPFFWAAFTLTTRGQ